MAVRKETIKQQMAEALRPALEPGERQVGGIFVIAGTSPWIAQGLLGLLGQFLVDYYFVALTDRRVVFIRTSRVSGRAKEIAFSEPRSPDPIVEHQIKSLWSVVKFRHGDGKPMRLNVHRIWRNELQDFLAAFGRSESPLTPPASTDRGHRRGQPYLPPGRNGTTMTFFLRCLAVLRTCRSAGTCAGRPSAIRGCP